MELKTKLCINCKEIKNIDEFTHIYKKSTRIRAKCKICLNDLQKLKRFNNSLGLPGRVKYKPNTYNSEYEKSVVFDMMKTMGWTFNEENGIWFKEGIKDMNGKFDNVTEKILTRYNRKIKPEDRIKIYEMRIQNIPIPKIAEEFKVSIPTIYHQIKQYAKENR
jgi:hypothetical protein